MTSKVPVIPGLEDEAEWLRHLEGVRASLQPEGYLEDFLARRIAFLLWRLERVTQFEIAATMRHINSTAFHLAISANYLSGTDEVVEPEPETVDEHQEGRILPSDGDRARIMRYESHIHRLWTQTQNQLRALQAQRRGERVPLAFVDFSAPPDMGPKRTSAQ